jgi:hypothetical protein
MYRNRKFCDAVLALTFAFGLLLAAACSALATDWPPPVGETPNQGNLCNLQPDFCLWTCTNKTVHNPKAWFVCPGIPAIWNSVERLDGRLVGTCINSGTTCSMWATVACVKVRVRELLHCQGQIICEKFIDANNKCLPSPG